MRTWRGETVIDHTGSAVTAEQTGRPEALREAAKRWRGMGRHLEGITRDLDQGVRDTRETHWRGPAADAFGEEWTRLKGSVDDALPVFELAAAGLDNAADRIERTSTEPAGTEADDTTAVDHTQLITQIAFAANALSQIGAQLGVSFGGAAGKRQRAARTSAPTGPLPAAEGSQLPNGVIGIPVAQAPKKDKPSGGLGVAAGVRTPASEYGAFG
jgi:WXG100 family type VII secretion target